MKALRTLYLWVMREIALARAHDWQPVPHEAFRHDEDAALKLRLKQEVARQAMVARGDKTLLTGAPGYWKIVDMSKPADAKKVVRLSKAKR